LVGIEISFLSSERKLVLVGRLLRISARIGWLEGEAEERGLLAQGALLALAGEGGVAE
jgi:hypothetical protein